VCWHPKVSIEEGVGRLLGHLADFKDLPVWTADSIAKATEDWFRYLGEDQ